MQPCMLMRLSAVSRNFPEKHDKFKPEARASLVATPRVTSSRPTTASIRRGYHCAPLLHARFHAHAERKLLGLEVEFIPDAIEIIPGIVELSGWPYPPRLLGVKTTYSISQHLLLTGSPDDLGTVQMPARPGPP